MYRIVIPFLLIAALVSCSDKITGERPYNMLYKEFPAQGGTYLVLTNPAAIGSEMAKFYDIRRNKPWPLWPTVGLEESKAKLSEDKTRLKGEWYEMYWKNGELYLKLDHNRHETRDVYVGFLNDNDIPCISSLIRQKGDGE